MRSALLLVACLGVACGQLSPEDQGFIDAALGVGGGAAPIASTGGGNSAVPVSGGTDYPTCEGGTKSCVPYFLCENNNIVTDGAGLINIRFGGSEQPDLTQHSECQDEYTSVCCSDPLLATKEPIQVGYQPSCGRRNPFGINARIVGIKDNESQFGEFPWNLAVLKEDNGKLVFVCGGALIAPNALVTAAHCVYDQNNLVVRLGEWDTQHTTEFLPHLDAGVVKVVVHEQYNHARQNLHNDIAVLFLGSDIPLQEHIDTICLPEPNNQPIYGPSTNCYVTGWGKNSFEEGQFQLVLKQVTLPLVDHDTCQAQLQQTRLGRRFLLHSGFLCAGGNGQDACTGDGGSPLVCPDPTNPDRYILRGIVSWGIGCATVNVPGVYVDVTSYSQWISDQIQNYQPLP